MAMSARLTEFESIAEDETVEKELAEKKQAARTNQPPADVRRQRSREKKPSVTIREPPPGIRSSLTSSGKEDPKQEGILRQAIPTMPLPLALFCCLLNIFLPGFGTLLSSFALFCCATSRLNKLRAFFLNILCALLQMFTFIIIIGWIWSILWGRLFVQLARMTGRRQSTSLPSSYYVRRQSSVDAGSTYS